MEEFLNGFMSLNKNIDEDKAEQLSTLFNTCIEIVFRAVGGKAFRLQKARSPFNNAIFDAVMVGIGRRLEMGNISNIDQLRDQYNKLIQDESFIALVTGPTTDEENVKARIQKATDAFSNVE